jgi:hypothetical protein
VHFLTWYKSVNARDGIGIFVLAIKHCLGDETECAHLAQIAVEIVGSDTVGESGRQTGQRNCVLNSKVNLLDVDETVVGRRDCLRFALANLKTNRFRGVLWRARLRRQISGCGGLNWRRSWRHT